MKYFLCYLLVSLSCRLGSSLAPIESPAQRCNPKTTSRRQVFQEIGGSSLLGIFVASTAVVPQISWAAGTNSRESFTQSVKLIKEARKQLEQVPDLIKAEKWDSVRALLITAPLSDCWAKTNRPLLSNYAESLGDLGGDELAAMEAKEDTNSHLRYLDMAVYNNVFNPIKTMGETGATQGLIKSYYEDPINEFKASVAALDELIKLGEGL